LKSLLFGDLQGGVFVSVDHGAKIRGRDILNDAAGSSILAQNSFDLITSWPLG
jgi:hypothetical protein